MINKNKFKKAFTLVELLIYTTILSIILLPTYIFITNIVYKILFDKKIINEIQYLDNNINWKTPDAFYYILNWTSTWKVYWIFYSNWRKLDYWTDLDQTIIMNNNFINKIFDSLKHKDKIKINFFIKTTDYIWQNNVYKLENFLLSWKYFQNKSFICKWIKVLNKNGDIYDEKWRCFFWYWIKINKKLNKNAYQIVFYDFMNNIHYLNIILWETDKINNF